MIKKAMYITAILLLIVMIVSELLAMKSGIFTGVFPGFPKKENINDRLPEIEVTHEIESDIETIEDSNIDAPINITYENIFAINNFDIIRKNLYNIDKTAYVYDADIDVKKLLSHDMRVDLYGDKPKILIFHTHSREAFSDSREGFEEDTIVGIGEALALILYDKYKIPVLHHKGVYDMKDGENVRDGSYERMEPDILSLLEDNPEIEILIDLHRDSLPGGRRLVTDIDGRETATIMFFNGICRENKNGEPKETDWLTNEYLEENLALSLRMKLLANQLYPDFTRKNYIKPYRYSLHMKPKSLLIEVGSDANTVKEAKNAMIPLASIIVAAFS